MMMKLERFWSIIDQSRIDFDPNRLDGNMDAQLARLTAVLSGLPPRDIGAFVNRFIDLFHRAYSWDLWAAGYIIFGGCSDDGFTDFRYWLMSMGRSVFDNAINDAESLAEVAFGPGIEVTRFEEFGYVANRVLQQLNVGETEAGIIEVPYPDAPRGDSWEYDELPIRFPKLTAAKVQYGA